MDRSAAKPAERLSETLRRIDGRGYRAYKDIEGEYSCGDYDLIIDHVQGDPFAAPSRVRVRVGQGVARMPSGAFSSRSRRVALSDFLARCFCAACRQGAPARGSGKSGLIEMAVPGQEILERNSVVVSEEELEARFTVGLPAFGRRIAGREAADMLLTYLPRIVRSALCYESLDAAQLELHLDTAEDADILRAAVLDRGCIAFVADGSILPRASGVDPRPLDAPSVVPFMSPASMRMEIVVPHRGRISGMAVRRGVLLIVGGGYHGKSTVLKAIESGVYNHVPGDGREMVVSDPGAVKVRAEDGRRIAGVDISSFIDRLPGGTQTTFFSTEDASGSTSQAASIIEAVEAGATTLLMDEDTSATNFMIRDRRMQALIDHSREPITPFIDRVRSLFHVHGVSTILVLGGSGDYFDVADRVVAMDEYAPQDVTDRARKIALQMPTNRVVEGSDAMGGIRDRVPCAESVSARKGKREQSVSVRGRRMICFGTQTIDLSAAEQIVDVAQTRAIGDALVLARRFMGSATLREIVEAVEAEVERHGLDCLGRFVAGEYARFRSVELAMALNRLRTLRVGQGL